ncbi:MAG: hypothetical protein K5770_08700 [Lachnospiraceae bacterium]|nr:hypothetical protein [Lachnospiraceae bacterium]
MKNLGKLLFRRMVMFFAALSVVGAVFVFAAPESIDAREGKKARDIIEEDRAEAIAKEAEAKAAEEVEDYDFVVLEDEEVPLAMAPERAKNKKAPVVWVVICALLLVGAGIYIIAFLRYRERVRLIEKNLSREDKKSLKDGCLMFHPMKRAEMADEIENELVSKYFE